MTTPEDLDLLALRFFLHLVEHHNHKLTCSELGLSSSKGSRLLNTLRAHFKDELFVRFGANMFPTRKAESLVPQVRSILEQVNALKEEKAFDPRHMNTHVRIAAYDAGVASFIASIAPKLEALAPHVQLDVVQIHQSLVEDLKKGRCDLAISPWINRFSELHTQVLFERRFVLLLAKSHPLVSLFYARGGILMTDLHKYRQVTVTLEVQYTWGNDVDLNAMRSHQSARSERAITTPYFLSVPLFVRNTHHYAFVTEQMGKMFIEQFPDLTLLPIPEGRSEERQPTMLVWSDLTHEDPAMQWVRSLFLTSKTDRVFYS